MNHIRPGVLALMSEKIFSHAFHALFTRKETKVVAAPPLFFFFTALFGFFAAEFPDDAAGAEFAVEAGVGAGLT